MGGFQRTDTFLMIEVKLVWFSFETSARATRRHEQKHESKGMFGLFTFTLFQILHLFPTPPSVHLLIVNVYLCASKGMCVCLSVDTGCLTSEL